MFSFIKRWRSRRNDLKASEAVSNQGVSQESASAEQLVPETDALDVQIVSATAGADVSFSAEQLVPETDALDVQIVSATAGADFSFLPSSELPPGLVIVPASMEASLVTTGNGRAVLRLANGNPAASSAGRTAGYSIRVSDQAERTASGKPVRVLVVARVAEAASSSRLAIAYSTNDVGNSGWRWFPVGHEWTELEMDYNVPPMKNGNGDFIGLLPDKQGTQAVEVSVVALKVNPVKEQTAQLKPQ